VAAALTFDGELVRQDKACSDCGRTYRLIRAFILRDGDAYAAAFIALHEHGHINEAWIDVILGTWGDDTINDHVTFGSRVGPVEGQSEPAASLVDGAIPYENRPIWGLKLTREQALGHSRLPEYWDVVDYLLLKDAEIHAHVYGQSGPGQA
jgi:hypothetical protein